MRELFEVQAPLIGAFVLYKNAITALREDPEEAFENLGKGIFRSLLLDDGYVPDVLIDHCYRDVLHSELATGGGYARGGYIMRGTRVIGSPFTFTADTIIDINCFTRMFNFIVIVWCAGVFLSPDDELLCYSECGRPVIGYGGRLTIRPSLRGIFGETEESADW